MARLPAAQESIGINALTAAMEYLTLNTGDPGTTGANEVSGGSYTRQAVAWTSSSGGAAATNTGAENFTGMPSATVPYFGTNNTAGSSGGTYEGGGQLGASLTVPAGATVAFAISAISVELT